MSDPVVQVQNLKKYFPIKMGFFRTLMAKDVPVVHAVDDVSFGIKPEEILGLVGESGCGKTTTGRCLLRLIESTAGKIIFQGKDITSIPLHSEMRKLRQIMQIIFQDPYESLNPRMSVYDIISEPMTIQNVVETQEEVMERVIKVMEEMGLTPPREYLYRFPHELSGGQRQRVAVARAFVLEPKFIVADEPVSMLDASIRSEVIHLILNMVKEVHCSFLYITHDIALTRYICNRVAVMYLGKIVEKGPTEELVHQPLHPYSAALIAAVPVPDPTAERTAIVLKGEVPSALAPPSGCRFHTRCPHAEEICRRKEPELIASGKERFVACHFPLGKQ